jgi:hypothetical protein
MNICCKWKPNGWKKDDEVRKKIQQESEQFMNIFNEFFLFFVFWCWIVCCKLMVMANISHYFCVSYVQVTNGQGFCFEAFDDLWWW